MLRPRPLLRGQPKGVTCSLKLFRNRKGAAAWDLTRLSPKLSSRQFGSNQGSDIVIRDVFFSICQSLKLYECMF